MGLATGPPCAGQECQPFQDLAGRMEIDILVGWGDAQNTVLTMEIKPIDRCKMTTGQGGKL